MLLSSRLVKLWSALLLALAVTAFAPVAAGAKTRVILTTDGEGDDIGSMHRFLLYANDFDVEGIVTSASRWHWAGDPDATPPIPERSWHGTEWIRELIDGPYRTSYPTLRANDPRYPRPDRLISLIKEGNIKLGGEMATNTEGSELIKEALLQDDPDDIHLQAWGGTNTIAAALRSIRDEYKGTPYWNEIYRSVSDKAVIYIIQDQDRTYKDYIATNWPDVRVVMNRDQFEAFAYGSWSYNPPSQLAYFQQPFISANIQQGPMGPSYPTHQGVEGNSLCYAGCQAGDWFSEGDSPSFLHAIPTGLGNVENPAYGGWGGRFMRVSDTLWADDPAYVGAAGQKATDLSPFPIMRSFATPTNPQYVRLRAAAPAGSTNIKLTRVRMPKSSGIHPSKDIIAGDKITIGSGDQAETRIVKEAGGGGAAPTTLFDTAPAGATNIKVPSVQYYYAGDPLTIGTGGTAQEVTITKVGTQRVATTASVAANAGDTVLKVQSTGASCTARVGCFNDAVMKAGDDLRVGTGPDQFTVKIKSVGTPFADGTGVTLESPLPAAVAAGATVVDPGSGISFTPALNAEQAAGTAVSTLGSGITLDQPLTREHAVDAEVADYNSPGWPQARWNDAIQNDMAARIGWTYKGYNDANHQPRPQVEKATATAAPGATVPLKATVTDPDGDVVALNWWQYREAGTYAGQAPIADATKPDATLTVPTDAKPGDTIHVILSAKDDGTPALTRYQRVVVTVVKAPDTPGGGTPGGGTPGGGTPGGGTPGGGTPGGGTPDTAKPTLSLRGSRNQSLPRLKRRGLSFPIRISEAGTIRATLTARIKGKSVRLGRVTLRNVQAGSRTVRVRIGAKQLRRLKGVRRFNAVLELRATDLAGNSTTRKKTLRFR